ncbi:MG2 domain-containing protein [Candidatus Riflebacteria bacterium]
MDKKLLDELLESKKITKEEYSRLEPKQDLFFAIGIVGYLVALCTLVYGMFYTEIKRLPVEKIVYKEKIVPKYIEKKVPPEIVIKEKIVTKIVEKKSPAKIIFKDKIITKFIEKKIPQPPGIVHFSPTGNIDSLKEIFVIFNKPMAEKKSLNNIFYSFPMQVSPDLKPSFVWVAVNKLQIFLAAKPGAGTKIAFNFARDIKDIEGLHLQKDESFSLIFKPLKFKSVYFNSYARPASFNLRFSAEIEGTALASHLKISDAKGASISYRLGQTGKISKDHRVYIKEESLSGRGKISFTLSKGIKTFRGNHPLEKTISYKFKNITSLAVNYLRTKSRKSKQVIELDFNREIFSIEGMKKYFELKPEVAFTISKTGWSSISIASEKFEPGKSFTLTIKKGFRSGAFSITYPHVETVVFKDQKPELYIKSQEIIQSSKGQLKLPIEYINTNKLFITVHQIFANNLVYFANNSNYSRDDKKLFYKIGDFNYTLPEKKNKMQKHYLDLKELFKGKLFGPKLLQFSYKGSYSMTSKLHIISDIGITYKRLDREGLVLCTSLLDGSPVENASLEIFSKPNQLLASGNSNNNGIFRFPIIKSNKGTPNIIIVKKEDDINYLPISRGHVPTTNFDVKGDNYLKDDAIEAFIFGEREIYRPGEIIKAKLLARKKNLEIAAQLPVTISFSAPDGRVVLKKNLQLDSTGQVDFQIPTAFEALTGYYTLKANIVGSKNLLGSTRVQIEEFVPDRIETKISASKDKLLKGDSVNFSVTGKYLIGKPAANNKVSAVYSLFPVPFSQPKYKTYSFGDPGIKFKEIFNELGSSKLNDKGKIDYKIQVPGDLRPPAAIEMIFTATVFDMGARGVSARKNIKIYPYSFYPGIRCLNDNIQSMKRGQNATFEIIAIKPDGTKIKEQKLLARIYKNEWNYSLKADHQGRYRYHWEREEVLVFKKELQVKEGKVELAYQLQNWGEHVLKVSHEDSGSQSSLTFSTSWVEGQGGRKMDFDRIELSLDKKSYRPGETARVAYKTPFTGRAYIFFENDKLRFHKLLTLEKKEGVLSIPLEAEFAPNVYLSVLAVRGTQAAKFNNFRAMGLIPIKVRRDEKILKLQINTPEKLEPGKEQDLEFFVNNSNNEPVEGELALSIVDKGILQLSSLDFGNPYDFFYRKRGNFTRNSDLFAFVIGEPEKKVARSLSPSGGIPDSQLKRHKMPIQVKRGKPTSYWFPKIPIKNGKARIQIKWPQFSGQLNIRAWASTENAVGFNSKKKEIIEPLSIETILPRALSPEDEFSFPVKVRNNLKEEKTFKLNLTSNGEISTINYNKELTLKAMEDRKIYFEAKAGSKIGIAKINIVLGEKDPLRQSYEIPIRPSYPAISETHFEVIPVNHSYQKKMENKFIDNTVSYKFIISSLPDIRLLSGLNYLVRYPHGCIEQTTSKVFPQLYVGRILQLIDKNKNNSNRITRNVNHGIQRIADMATTDGGFSSWPGGENSYTYGTVYAGHFLAEAHKAGYPVPKILLHNLKGYLGKVLNNRNQENSLRAYSCYVLALLEQANPAIAEKLLLEVKGYHSYYLVASLALAGKKEKVKKYIYAKSPATAKIQRTTYGVLKSEVIADAVILNALLEIREQPDVQASLVASLIKKAKYKGRWGSTHENALALIAIGKYFNTKEVESSKPLADLKFSGQLTINEAKKYSFNSSNDFSFTLEDEVENYGLNSSGKGELFFTLIGEGIPLKGLAQEFSRGLELKHNFYNLKGQLINNITFAQGELYIAETEIAVTGRQGNLYLEHILPGGFELENTRLKSRARDIPFLRGANLPVEYIDLKDDRIVVYFNSLNQSAARHNFQRRQNSEKNKPYKFRFLLRAVTKGHFNYPATSAGSMYDPDMQCLKFNTAIKIQ